MPRNRSRHSPCSWDPSGGGGTSMHVAHYRLWLEKRTKPRALSAQTVGHILADLRCMLNWAEDSGFIARSPFPAKAPAEDPRAPARPAHG